LLGLANSHRLAYIALQLSNVKGGNNTKDLHHAIGDGVYHAHFAVGIAKLTKLTASAPRVDIKEHKRLQLRQLHWLVVQVQSQLLLKVFAAGLHHLLRSKGEVQKL